MLQGRIPCFVCGFGNRYPATEQKPARQGQPVRFQVPEHPSPAAVKTAGAECRATALPLRRRSFPCLPRAMERASPPAPPAGTGAPAVQAPWLAATAAASRRCTIFPSLRGYRSFP
ncbi:unnamed protein product [Adineta ricciae]|uniref:Uncharacterized protein n=1 Tax=Adineta ricciae TaxID=249248 RepID=A0A815SM62_ADIRI|nr:unnamed protein product [Adineta ricciae]CAF1493344.1 unnamed protein product [Adineta ricciae]